MAIQNRTTKTTALALIALTVVSFSLWLWLRPRESRQSIEITEERETVLPDYQPPKRSERAKVELATELVNWWSRHQESNLPYPYGFSCNFLGDCSRQDESHRDNIPLLWARNEIFRQTYDPAQLSALINEIDRLDRYMEAGREDSNALRYANSTIEIEEIMARINQPYMIKDGEEYQPQAFIWQVDYYHCLLIDQIIATNLYLPEESIRKLDQFCRTSTNDAEISEIFTEADHQALVARITPKLNALISPENMPYDWENDPTVQQFRAWELDDYHHDKNVLFFADFVVKDEYPGLYPQPAYDSVENYLDTALTSYFLRLQGAEMSVIERYHLDSRLLLGLQTYLERFPNQNDFPIAYFFDHLVSQLVFPDQRELEIQLYKTKDIQWIADLCFLEKKIDKGLRIYPEIYQIIMEYHQVQKERSPNDDFQPFYYSTKLHPTAEDHVVYNLQANGLLAGCLINSL